MTEKQYVTIGERLKKIRTILGLTRKELAAKFDVGENFYGQIEAGRTIPTPQLLLLLADSYKVNINYLLTGKGSSFIDDVILSNEFVLKNNNEDSLERVKNLEKQVALLTELLVLKKN
jgi:transcriptional regulator with XRE-family HTH domain